MTPGKSWNPHPPHDVRGMTADLGVRGFPAHGNLPYDQRVGVSAPVAGVSESLSLLLHREEGPQRSKTGTHDDSILLDSPYIVSWIGPELKVLTEPGRAPFRILLHRHSGAVPHQSETPGAGRCGAVSNETPRRVHRPEQQIPKPAGAQIRGKWRQHLSMARYKKHARHQVGTSRASLHFSKSHSTSSWTPSGIAPRSIFAPPSG